jgi:uncharacterized protein YkwD
MRGTRRTRVTLAVAALAIALVGAACSPVIAPAPGPCVGPPTPPDAVSSAVFTATNLARQSSGLEPLTWNPQLWCLASDWSNQMAASGYIHHRELSPVLRSADYDGYDTLGENVLHGPSSMSGDAMQTAWIGSPEHRANILSPAFSSFAVAFTVSGGEGWATANFGG